MNEYPSTKTSDYSAESPPPLPQAEESSKITDGHKNQPSKFSALRTFLIFHFAITALYLLGHIFNGLPESLNQGYIRNINLELIRIVTSSAHLVCIAGIFKFKTWGWQGYKIVWILSLVLHLMVGSLDLILLILFASAFTGIIYALLRNGGSNSAMNLLK